MWIKRGDSSKKGQVTLFIIIAIIILAIVLFGLMFFPRILKERKPTQQLQDPEKYIQECIGLNFEPIVEILSKQGGYLETENCIFYNNSCRSYLCYTSQSYATCINQEPLLKQHIEKVLEEELKKETIVDTCISKFRDSAIKQGYDVAICDNPSFSVEIVPSKIKVPINCLISVSKNDDKKQFEKFEFTLQWPLYEFILVTERIIYDEQKKGNFDYVSFMLVPLNRWIEIKLERRTEQAAKIYILKEIATSKEFGFAIRSQT